MRYLSEIGRPYTCARLPCITRFIILDFTLLAQWTPPTSPVPRDSATLRGYLQYALPLWDRQIACTRVRLPYIAQITILDFTLLAQWTPPDISSSRRFSDSQRVLAICATSLRSADRILVLDSDVSPGSLSWTSLYSHNGLI